MQTCINTITKGVSAFHVVNYVKEELLQTGFQELKLTGNWQLEEEKNYLLSPYPSMLIAVSVGKLNTQSQIRLSVAHTDSPCLKVKANADMPDKEYIRMNVEPYGGLLKHTWFDRPLGMAGKVVLRGADAFHPQVRYVDSKTAIGTIPSLAPHLSRGTETKEIQVQQELIPIIGLAGEEMTAGHIKEYLETHMNVKRSDILNYDLFLYPTDKPVITGLKNELLQAPRIDNLASVAAMLEAMQKLSGSRHNNLAIAVMFDNEEIGSRSKQGADSVLLQKVLEKLGRGLQQEPEHWQDMLAEGFLLSMDGAQGHHPNYPDKSDPTNQVYLGKGIVIKTSASQRYLSDSTAAAIVIGLCEQEKIPWQQQVNRSGMPGGQTLGPLVAAYLPMLGVDIGIPMLAMHSANELAACADYQALKQLVTAYYTYSA